MPEFCILVKRLSRKPTSLGALEEKQVMINLILKHKSLIIIIFPPIIRKVVPPLFFLKKGNWFYIKKLKTRLLLGFLTYKFNKVIW